MVSVCQPSDALLQHLPSFLGFSYLGHGVSLHCYSRKAQPLLLILKEGYRLSTSLPDLQHEVSSLGPAVLAQPRFLDVGLVLPAAAPGLGRGFAPPGRCPWPWTWGSSSPPPPQPRTRGSSSPPFLRRHCLTLSAAAPDLGRGVTPLGRHPLGMGSSRLIGWEPQRSHLCFIFIFYCNPSKLISMTIKYFLNHIKFYWKNNLYLLQSFSKVTLS